MDITLGCTNNVLSLPPSSSFSSFLSASFSGPSYSGDGPICIYRFSVIYLLVLLQHFSWTFSTRLLYRNSVFMHITIISLTAELNHVDRIKTANVNSNKISCDVTLSSLHVLQLYRKLNRVPRYLASYTDRLMTSVCDCVIFLGRNSHTSAQAHL